MIDFVFDVLRWLLFGFLVVAEAGVVYVGFLWYGADNALPRWWKLFGLAVALLLTLHLGWCVDVV